MELKISDGRYCAAEGGGLETVSGSAEALQRALMRLKTPRGSFLPCPDYGSALHTLGKIKPSLRAAAAKQFVFEALEGEEGVSVAAVDYDGSGRVSVELLLGGGSAVITLEEDLWT